MEQTDASACERLSPRMRDCLRLVYERKSSKEIAPILGISEGAINGYLAEAIRLLGARNRRDAAERLHIYEVSVPEKLKDESLRVVVDQPAPPTGAASPAWRAISPSRPLGARFNDLRFRIRLFWIVALPIILSIAFGLLVIGFHTVSEIVRSFRG